MTARGLSVVVCGAGPAAHVATLVRLAQRAGWTVSLISTPSALSFLDAAALEVLTGAPVRSEYRDSQSGPRTLSTVEAAIVAPATYNTINKLALGISDNYALGNVAEAIGRGTPVVAVPFVNAALAARQPYQHAVQLLRQEGVTILTGAEYGWEPHEPGIGDERARIFPWAQALEVATKRTTS